MPSIQSFNKTRQRAKELRQQMAPAKKVLWIRLRNQRMVGYGYRVLRVSNQEIETDLESLMRRILEACQDGAESPLPASGEGQG
jgi:very-short-patch-repair endonuclease